MRVKKMNQEIVEEQFIYVQMPPQYSSTVQKVGLSQFYDNQPWNTNLLEAGIYYPLDI